jgi:membrane protein DedA with SNARE-associated domain
METINDLLRDSGSTVYLVLFAYCALKSGVLPVFAGYAAHLGVLDLTSVVLSVFVGGYLGDEIRFHLARFYGVGLTVGRPRLARLIGEARAMMDRYGALYIFAYRYPKGLRTVGALPVGLSEMSWRRFTLLNAASASLWTALLVGAGFLFGAAIERIVTENFAPASILLLLLFIVVAVIGWRKSAAQVSDRRSRS